MRHLVLPVIDFGASTGAIAILKFVEEEQDRGRKIQTMNRDGKDKLELILM